MGTGVPATCTVQYTAGQCEVPSHHKPPKDPTEIPATRHSVSNPHYFPNHVAEFTEGKRFTNHPAGRSHGIKPLHIN